MIRVDRATLRVEQVSTWFHNRFLLYDRENRSLGTEPVLGAIHTEGESHVLVYSQSQGHGVRLLQTLDLGDIDENVKILRHRGDRRFVATQADRSLETDATYELLSLDAWYAQARGPFGRESHSPGLFEDSILLGVDQEGEELRVGRFIGGRDFAKGSWSRPKPPWSWDDGWDRVPIAAWHFHPSLALDLRGRRERSHAAPPTAGEATRGEQVGQPTESRRSDAARQLLASDRADRKALRQLPGPRTGLSAAEPDA